MGQLRGRYLRPQNADRGGRLSNKRHAGFEKLWRAFGRECAYCWRPLLWHDATRDHVIPESEGGTAALDNIVPACRDCNTSKGHQNVAHWLRALGRDAEAVLARIRHVRLLVRSW